MRLWATRNHDTNSSHQNGNHSPSITQSTLILIQKNLAPVNKDSKSK